MRTLDDLIHIVRNGGGLDLQAGSYSADDLTHLARNATNARIVLRGINHLSTDDLIHIGRNGSGNVIFVFD